MKNLFFAAIIATISLFSITHDVFAQQVIEQPATCETLKKDLREIAQKNTALIHELARLQGMLAAFETLGDQERAQAVRNQIEDIKKQIENLKISAEVMRQHMDDMCFVVRSRRP